MILVGESRPCFIDRCCGVESGAGRITCKDDAASRWVDGVYALIAACRLASLLFAPLLLTWILYSQSVQKTDYILRLKDYLVKTLLVKRVTLTFHIDRYVSLCQVVGTEMKFE